MTDAENKNRFKAQIEKRARKYYRCFEFSPFGSYCRGQAHLANGHFAVRSPLFLTSISCDRGSIAVVLSSPP